MFSPSRPGADRPCSWGGWRLSSMDVEAILPLGCFLLEAEDRDQVLNTSILKKESPPASQAQDEAPPKPQSPRSTPKHLCPS